MDKRYQVFVSSTFTDLKDERRKVIEALLHAECFPAGMEYFPASGKINWYIKKIIDDSDFYLLIIGGRYGSTDETGISYTEQEYDYALEKGLKLIVFIHGDLDQIPLGKSEKNNKLRKQLLAFRDKVKNNGSLIKEWLKAEDLSEFTSQSVNSLIRQQPKGGWVKSKTLPSYEEEIKHYPNFAAATLKICELIEKSPANEPLRIQWLGSSMANATPLIKEEIIKRCEQAKRKLHLEITMLSAKWKYIDRYNRNWKKQLNAFSQGLSSLKTDYPHVVETLTIHTYKQVPHLTGGLINNQHLFIAYCEWERGGIYHVGSHQRYLYYKSGDVNWTRKYTDFSEWFAHLQEEQL